jgi:peptide/nickel transport system ATP-binding protein
MHSLAGLGGVTLIAAENLSRSFGGGWFGRGAVRAVSDVSFAIAPGEALGLVGESGSGKSTIGRLLLGLMAPSAGRVVFDGADVGTLRGKAARTMRRRTQMVFQDPGSSLDPRRRIGAQIADGMGIHGLCPPGERSGRVGALLEQVGLPASHADRFPHEFSGGQRQRVGIARALATNPDLLVADEPVSALDVSVQAQVLALLADLRGRLGLAMLFISHDLHVVRGLCDRVMVLYLGRVMEEGRAADVLTNPVHPYTKALLAAAPSLRKRETREAPLGGEPPSPANPPSGCVFRTRCPMAIEVCSQTPPTLRPVGADGHRAACLREDVFS